MFGKGKNEVIDFTVLQKRRLIKKDELKKQDIQTTKNDYVSLTSKKEQEIINNEISSQTSPLDMLNSLALVGNEETSKNSLSLQESSQVQSLDFQNLLVKLDNLEYKIERLIDRISEIENKMKGNQSN